MKYTIIEFDKVPIDLITQLQELGLSKSNSTVSCVNRINKVDYCIISEVNGVTYLAGLVDNPVEVSTECSETDPSAIVRKVDKVIITDNHPQYREFDGLREIVNKRDGMINSIKLCHYSTSSEPMIVVDTDQAIQLLVNKIRNKYDIIDERIVEVITYYEYAMKPIAKYLSSRSVPKVYCNNDLFSSNILVNDKGSIKITDWYAAGYNDYAWDYACLLARSSNSRMYLSIMNSKVPDEVALRYSDDLAVIRILMFMVLVDLIDILKIYLTSDEEESMRYENSFEIEGHTIDLLIRRYIRFIDQSYTSIDYFKMKYNLK